MADPANSNFYPYNFEQHAIAQSAAVGEALALQRHFGDKGNLPRKDELYEVGRDRRARRGRLSRTGIGRSIGWPGGPTLPSSDPKLVLITKCRCSVSRGNDQYEFGVYAFKVYPAWCGGSTGHNLAPAMLGWHCI